MNARDAMRGALSPVALAVALALGAGCGAERREQPDLGGLLEADLAAPVAPTFSALYASYLGECVQCHAAGAPGRTPDIETSLDFSTQTMAYQTLRNGKATGLTGAKAACNGVAFVVPGSPDQSLLVAVLAPDVRATFGIGACTASHITDEAAKVGTPPSAGFLAALRAWIVAGAANN